MRDTSGSASSEADAAGIGSRDVTAPRDHVIAGFGFVLEDLLGRLADISDGVRRTS